MRGLVVFLIVIVVLSSLSFLALSIKDNKIPLKNSKNIEFRTFTSAVCESKNDLVNCRDELFVDCNGKISKADEIKECNGFELKNQKVTGFAVFGSEWKDSRNFDKNN